MADINHIISLGIGSPAAIPEFITFGLQGIPPGVLGTAEFTDAREPAHFGMLERVSHMTFNREPLHWTFT